MPQKTKNTPMMEQYLSIKAQYQDAFLFYRLGDFYELFNEDAVKAAQILELTLTSRNKMRRNRSLCVGCLTTLPAITSTP